MKKLNTLIYPFLAMALWMAGSAGHSYGQSTAWELTINGQDQNANNIDIVIGTAEGATDGFDTSLDQYAPPPAPTGTFDFRIVDDNDDYFKQYRALTTNISSWTISAVASEGGTKQFTLSWDNTSLLSSLDFYLIEYDPGSGIVQVDIKEQTTLVLPSGTEEVTVIHVVQNTLSESFTEGWQQIGYPGEAANVDPFSVFSNGLDGTFITYQGSYSVESEFSAGYGYWIRLSGAETVAVSPPFLTEVSRTLGTGWHMISGPGTTVALTDIEDPSSILVAGSLQGYDSASGYSPVDSMKPGYGYWIQTDGSGTITMNSEITDGAAKADAMNITDPEGFTAFRVSTSSRMSPKFYIGGSLDDASAVNPLSFSMPPLPPSGAFDVRFSNDTRLISGDNGTLLIQSPGDSLTLTHSNQTSEELRFTVFREGSDEENYNIMPDESVTFSAAGVDQIDVNVGVASSVDDVYERPERIELAQNYPNPFNPSTAISYKLPRAGEVTLEVFNMTGRRIAVLANEFQTAGSYNYDFDASNLSSGVYMYRLQFSGSTLTRKMTLIK